MQDRKTGRPNDRLIDSDATSKETVADLENSEESSPAKQGGGNESDLPSPDGAFDESDESKDAEPM